MNTMTSIKRVQRARCTRKLLRDAPYVLGGTALIVGAVALLFLMFTL